MKNSNSLLKDSSNKKRKLLESVRSYLDNERKTISLPSSSSSSSSSSLITKVEDSPERKKKQNNQNFGNSFKDLICQSNSSSSSSSSFSLENNLNSQKKVNETQNENEIERNILKLCQKRSKKQMSSFSLSSSIPTSSSSSSSSSSSISSFSSSNTLREQYQPSNIFKDRINNQQNSFDNLILKKNEVIVESNESKLVRNHLNQPSRFTNSNWRDRMKSFVLQKQNEPISSVSLQSSQSLSTNENLKLDEIVFGKDQENLKLDNKIQTQTIPDSFQTNKRASNLIPPKTEVSLNFVKKDLKRHGSYLVRGKKKKVSKRFLDNKSSYSSELGNNDKLVDGESENVRKKSKIQPIGLASFGLDPIQLYLDSNIDESLPLSNKSKNNENEHNNNMNNRIDNNSKVSNLIPLCSGHQMEAKLCTVRKSGLNKGRKFYSCSYPFDQRCKFFLWYEDNPNILTTPSRVVAVTPDDYIQSTLSLLRSKLKLMDTSELRFELTRIKSTMEKTKLKNNQKCPFSGQKKDDLVEKILWIAENIYNFHDDYEDNEDCKNDKNQSDNENSDSIIELSDIESDIESDNNNFNENIKDYQKEVYEEVDISLENRLIRLALKRSFGLSKFRPGQEWAINRVLSRKRSLLILPTGSGKTLTFMLPSLLCCPRDGLTIVVSPLVALMRDQLAKLPFNLPAACLSGDITAIETSKISTSIINGQLRILFVSPERLCSPSFQNLIKKTKYEKRLSSNTLCDDLSTKFTAPGIGLLCIDEVHCISQWSFNFRSSFLKICHEIDKIQPKSILALTATAPLNVQNDIINFLQIPSDGIFVSSPNRSNLLLYSQKVQNEDEKREIIVSTIQDKGYNIKNTIKKKYPSTIIYVWKRDEVESLSNYLNSQGISTKGYHAGLSSTQRVHIEHLFMKGVIDVIVATIAFGMGIDKSNVRIVILHSLPKDIESYIQEIGRAGRDGLISKCLMLLDSNDLINQHSLSYSQSMSQLQMLLLLQKIFVPNKALIRGSNLQFPRLENLVAINLDDISVSLDIPVSLIETILCHLELKPYQLILLEGTHYDNIYGSFKTNSYSEFDIDPLLRTLSKLNKINSNNNNSNNNNVNDNNNISLDYGRRNEFEVSLLSLSIELQMSPEIIYSKLYQLQKRELIVYNISQKSVYVRLLEMKFEDISESFEDWIWKLSNELTEYLSEKFSTLANRVINIWKFGHLLTNISNPTCDMLGNEGVEQDTAREYLLNYMSGNNLIQDTELNIKLSSCSIPFIHNSSILTSSLSSLIDEEQQQQHQQLLQKCRQHINILMIDPFLDEIIDKILNMSKLELGYFKLSLKTFYELRKELKAVMIGKILHGHQTSLIQLSDWGHRAQWSACKIISFPTIVSLC